MAKKKSPAAKKTNKTKKQSEEKAKEPPKHIDGSVLVAIFVVAILIGFLKLFAKYGSFELLLFGYRITLYFTDSSPAYYTVIGLISAGFLFLFYKSVLVAVRRRKSKGHAKKEAKPKPKEKIKQAKKAEEKKKASKLIKQKIKPKPGVLYFFLFMFSFVLFVFAFIYRNMPTIVLSLVLMFLSLLSYRLLKLHPISTAGKEKPKASQKKPVFNLMELFNPKLKKEPGKKPMKAKKIDLGRFETHFDALYNIVEKKGRVKISILSQYFGVDRKKIEEWAGILEEHNLLKMHYPAVGEPELIKITSKELAREESWQQKN
jgi:hypothetical protein